VPSYVTLITFTERGTQNVKETTKRAAAFTESAQKVGVTVLACLWTLGTYDGVIILEAPDDETAAAAMLQADRLGNVRTHTMRAFTAPEMENVLSKIS